MEQSESEISGPYHRSMQLLFDTVESNDSLEWDDNEYGKVEIFVKGMSRRWYKINAFQIERNNIRSTCDRPKTLDQFLGDYSKGCCVEIRL